MSQRMSWTSNRIHTLDRDETAAKTSSKCTKRKNETRFRPLTSTNQKLLNSRRKSSTRIQLSILVKDARNWIDDKKKSKAQMLQSGLETQMSQNHVNTAKN